MKREHPARVVAVILVSLLVATLLVVGVALVCIGAVDVTR